MQNHYVMGRHWKKIDGQGRLVIPLSLLGGFRTLDPYGYVLYNYKYRNSVLFTRLDIITDEAFREPTIQELIIDQTRVTSDPISFEEKIANSCPIRLSNENRITVPHHLRDKLRFEDGNKVALIGVGCGFYIVGGDNT